MDSKRMKVLITVVVGILAGVFIWFVAMFLTLAFRGTSSLMFGYQEALVLMGLMSTALTSISAGLVISQLRGNERTREKNNEINISSFYNKFMNYWEEWGMIFIKYPEVRKYFYDGVEIDKGNKDFDRAMATATYMDDLFIYSKTEVERIKKNFGTDVLPPEQYDSYLKYMEWMKTSPAYKTYLKYYSKNINRNEADHKAYNQ